MSEQNTQRQAESAVDRLLAGSGFGHASDIREELLELRSLAATAPLPSAAVRALMVGGASAALPATAELAPASKETPTAVLAAVGDGSLLPATEALPSQVPATEAPMKDELAARRRKRRAAAAGLAVAVALGGGATAAAAQEGGIPATINHLSAAVGSVVSQFVPGPAHTSQHEQPAVPAQSPGHGANPAPTAPNTTDSAGGAKPSPRCHIRSRTRQFREDTGRRSAAGPEDPPETRATRPYPHRKSCRRRSAPRSFRRAWVPPPSRSPFPRI
ncbi:hypothetical protein AAHB33_18485 [Paenarthrobacter sp. S56]|uniref:hypothetical protein n=1 Tax=Paenarthrobacter sp. S56 TaxID=3138179 RepID=UPI003219BA19